MGFESPGPAFIHRSTPLPRLVHGVAVGLVWAALLSIPHLDVCNCRYAAQTSSMTVFSLHLLLADRHNQSFAAPDACPALPGRADVSPLTIHRVCALRLHLTRNPVYGPSPSVISIIGASIRYALSPARYV